MHRSGRDAFEALFDTRARDDLVAVAEAHAGAKGAVLAPEGVELRVEAVDLDRKSTRLNSSHIQKSRMPSSA